MTSVNRDQQDEAADVGGGLRARRPRMRHRERSAAAAKAPAYLLILAFAVPTLALADADPEAPPDASAPSSGAQGQASPTGGYSTSIPLDLPAPRGDLTVPVSINYSTSPTVGAAGIGWNVPLAYVRQSKSISQRKPKYLASTPSDIPVRTVLDLGGGGMMMSHLVDNTYRPLVGAGVELKYLAGDTWRAFDGAGRVYDFTKVPDLRDETLWLLTEIRDRTGENKLRLTYRVDKERFPLYTTEKWDELLLTDVEYSFSDSGCAKHRVQLNYKKGHEITNQIPEGAVLAYEVSDGAPRVRTKLLESVVTWARSDATCTASAVRLKTVRFGYGLAPDTRQPQLTSADVWGQGDPATNAGASRPIARFSYGSPLSGDTITYGGGYLMPLPSTTASHDTANAIGYQWTEGSTSMTTRALRDVTGDNRADLVYRPNDSEGSVVARNIARPAGNALLAPSPFLDLDRPERLFESVSQRSEVRNVAGSTFNQREMIDWNGDGRPDVMTATAAGWEVELNKPGAQEGSISWIPSTTIDVAPIVVEVQKYVTLAHTSHWSPFQLERSIAQYKCWEQYSTPQGPIFYDSCDGVFGPTLERTHSEVHKVTEWKLQDVNGDALPDFLFSAPSSEHYGKASTEVRVMYNRGGAQPFAGASVRLHQTDCGVERTRTYELRENGEDILFHPHVYLSCGFRDVNGDGLVDFIDEGDRTTRPRLSDRPTDLHVYLGTGVPDSFTLGRSFSLPAPVALTARPKGYFAGTQCNATPILKSYEKSGLIDMTGDGVPDFVYQGFRHAMDGRIPILGVTPGDDTRGWWIMPGTSLGFAPPVRLETGSFDFQLSESGEGCPETPSTKGRTVIYAGIADMDGDGRPEAVRASGGYLHIASILGGGRIIGAHGSTRLTEIDNGYGGTTRIEWGNAKAEDKTPHQSPDPEIVVMSVTEVATRGLGPSRAPVRYAYGYALQTFTPLAERWTFAGYGRVVTLSGIEVSQGVVEGTASVADQIRPDELTTGSLARMALVGSTRDVHVFDGQYSTDRGALLLLDTSSRLNLHRGRHDRFKLVENIVPLNGLEPDCMGHDGWSFGPEIAAGDLCRSQVIPYVGETVAWEGLSKPAFGVASADSVQTHSIVRELDDRGRPLFVEHRNDVARSTDDTCVRYQYAKSTRTDRLVLDALASAHIVLCDTQARIAGERYRYDGLEEEEDGKADRGLVSQVVQEIYKDTSLVSSRTTETITYDKYGNVKQTGVAVWQIDWIFPLMRFTTTARDLDFSIAVTSGTTSGFGVPTLTRTVVRDPVTLAPTQIVEPHGTSYSHQFDGFGRLVKSSTSNPGSPEFLLSETIFADDPSSTTGRQATLRAFDNLTTTTTAAPTSTRSTFSYDEFGRTRYVRSELGADYGHRSVVTQYVKRDALGRVVFHADPFQTANIDGVSAELGTLYGTSYHFNADGRIRCRIEGSGPQPLNVVTSPTDDRYPNCFTKAYENGALVSRRVGPNESLPGDARYGILDEVRHSATGQLLSRARKKNAEVLERADFTYSRLGDLVGITRYGKPATLQEPQTWGFEHDSKGRTLASWEPAQAKRSYVYDTDGNLASATWTDLAGDVKGVSVAHDAYGRLVEQVETLNGAPVADTTATFYYDAPSGSPHQVTPTNLLGRLSWAKNATMQTYFGYDPQGRSVAISHVNDDENVPYIERRSYSSHGQLEEIGFDLPDSDTPETVRYVYDSAHRVRSVDWVDANGAESIFTATTMDDLGRYTAVEYGNGVTAGWKYRPDRRRELQHEVLKAQNGLRYRQHHVLDGEGRSRGRTEMKYTNGITRTFATTHEFDPLNRLARTTTKDGAIPTIDESYQYDPLGNLRKAENALGTAGDLAFSVDPLDRDRLCQSWNPSLEATPTTCDHRYDELGNTIVTEEADAIARRFTYDALGRVLIITKGAARATFSYDAFGGIAALDVTGSAANDNRQDRRYGDLIERARFQDGETTVELTERKIMGPMGVLARRRGTGASAITLYEHDDGQGGRYFTDGTGNIVQEVEYSAFGAALLDTGTPGDVRYTKELWNSGDTLRDFGVTQLGPRLYDPKLRRFLQRDPLIIQRGAAKMNPYAFSFNDPINFSDVTGLNPDGASDGSALPELFIPVSNPDNAYGLIGYVRIGGYWYGQLPENRVLILNDIPIPKTDIEAIRNAGSPVGVPGGIAGTVGAIGAVVNVTDAGSAWLVRAIGGFGQSVDGAMRGFLATVMRPDIAAQGAWQAVTHPAETARAIGEAAVTFGQAVASGDPEAIGALGFEAAGAVFGVGLVGKLGKLDKLADVGRAAGGGGKRFFRGAKPDEAPSFTPRPGEFKVDKTTGLVKDSHGVSVFDNPGSVSKKGFVPHEVNQASVPDSLQILQRGADPAHFEIMPRPGANLTPAEFTAACEGIVCL